MKGTKGSPLDVVKLEVTGGMLVGIDGNLSNDIPNEKGLLPHNMDTELPESHTRLVVKGINHLVDTQYESGTHADYIAKDIVGFTPPIGLVVVGGVMPLVTGMSHALSMLSHSDNGLKCTMKLCFSDS